MFQKFRNLKLRTKLLISICSVVWLAFAVTIIGAMVAEEAGLFYGALLGFGGVTFVGGILLALVIWVPYFSNNDSGEEQAELPAPDSSQPAAGQPVPTES